MLTPITDPMGPTPGVAQGTTAMAGWTPTASNPYAPEGFKYVPGQGLVFADPTLTEAQKSAILGNSTFQASPSIDAQTSLMGGTQAYSQANAAALGQTAGQMAANQNVARFQAAMARQQQMQAYQNAMQMAQGRGPSVAGAQLQAGMAGANQAGMAQTANMARGGGAGGAVAGQLAGMQAYGQQAMAANRQGGMARVGEQLGALGMAGQIAGGVRGNDQLSQQLAQQGMVDYEQLRQRQLASELDARIRQQAAETGSYQHALAENAQTARENANRTANLATSGIGAAGSALVHALSQGQNQQPGTSLVPGYVPNAGTGATPQASSLIPWR